MADKETVDVKDLVEQLRLTILEWVRVPLEAEIDLDDIQERLLASADRGLVASFVLSGIDQSVASLASESTTAAPPATDVERADRWVNGFTTFGLGATQLHPAVMKVAQENVGKSFTQLAQEANEDEGGA